MKYFCYIRKSTSAQIYARQLRQLTDFAKQDGILPHTYCLEKDLINEKEKVNLKKENELNKYITLVTESRSGTDQSRPALLNLIEKMKLEKTKDDVCLLLVECTRLGRSYEGNMRMFQDLKDNDIKFVVTTMPLLDTRIKHNNPATALVSDIVLAVFNWLAEQEHITTQERCQAGRKEARENRHVKFGRKNMTAEQLPKEFIKLMEEEAEEKKGKTITDLVSILNGRLERSKKQPISRATFYNYKRLYDQSREIKK